MRYSVKCAVVQAVSVLMLSLSCVVFFGSSAIAGLAPLAPSSEIGALTGTAEVSGGGSFTYTLPLLTPPHRGGLSAELNLVYSSAGGQGLAGVGWNLSGFSSIHRCPKSIVEEGYYYPVQLNAFDSLCLDGVRLILVDGVDFISPGNEYRPKHDLKTRVEIVTFDEGNRRLLGFKVWYDDGRIGYFGETTDSQVEFIQNEYPITREWKRGRVEDRHGNQVVTTYARTDEAYTVNPPGVLAPVEFTSTVESVPQTIEFTHANTAVGKSGYSFDYVDCWVPRAGFAEKNVLFRSTQCLSKVHVYGPAAAGWKKIRDYRITYHPATLTQGQVNIPKEIATCDAANVCLPPLQLTANLGYSGADPMQQAFFPGEIPDLDSDADADDPLAAVTKSSRRIWIDFWGEGVPSLLFATGDDFDAYPLNLSDGDFKVWEPYNADKISAELGVAVPNIYRPTTATDYTGTPDFFPLRKGRFGYAGNAVYGEAAIVGTYNEDFRPEVFDDTYSGPNLLTLIYGVRSYFDEFPDKQLQHFNYAPDWNNNGDVHDEVKGYFAWYNTANLGDHQSIIFGCYISGIPVRGDRGRIFFWIPKNYDPDQPGIGESFGFEQYLSHIGCTNRDQHVVIPDATTGIDEILFSPMVELHLLPQGYEFIPLEVADPLRLVYQRIMIKDTDPLHKYASMQPSGLPVSLFGRFHTPSCDDTFGTPIFSSGTPGTDKFADANGDGKPDLFRYELVLGDHIEVLDDIRGVADQSLGAPACDNDLNRQARIMLYINRGEGEFLPGAEIYRYSNWDIKDSYYRNFQNSYPGDVNSDGWADWILHDNASAGVGREWKILLNDRKSNGDLAAAMGVTFTEAPVPFGYLETWGDSILFEPNFSNWSQHGADLLNYVESISFNLAPVQMSTADSDINGDGVNDLVVIGPIHDPDSPVLDIWVGRKPEFEIGPVGAITRVEDGFGSSTSIQYGSLRDAEVYVPYSAQLKEGMPLPSEEKQYLYPKAPLTPSGGFVVHKIASDLGLDVLSESQPWEQTVYRYRAGEVALNGEGFLGFEVIESEQSAINYDTGEETHKQRSIQIFDFAYNEEWKSFAPSVSSPKETLSYMPYESDGLPLVLVSRTQYQSSIKTQTQSNGTVLYVPYTSNSTSRSYELSEANCSWESYACTSESLLAYPPLTEVTSSMQLDAFGNVRLVGTSYSGERTVVEEKAYVNDEVNWLFLLDHDVTTQSHDGLTLVRRNDHTYTAEGRLDVTTREKNGDASVYLETDFDYDPYGNPVRVTMRTLDGTERVSQTQYDVWGMFAEKKLNALEHQTTYEYNKTHGFLDTVTDPNGMQSKTRYDGFGRVVHSWTLGSDGSAAGNDVLVEYLPISAGYDLAHAAYRKRTTVLGGDTTEEYLDRLGRTIRNTYHTLNPGNDNNPLDLVAVDTVYDVLGQTPFVSDPYFLGVQTGAEGSSFTYDARGRVLQTVNSSGETNTTSYQGLTTTKVDPVGREFVVNANTQGWVIEQRAPGGQVTHYAYAPDGKVRQATRNADEVAYEGVPVPDEIVTYSYDTLRRQTGSSHPLSGTVSMTYNAFGEAVTSTDALGTVTETRYDKLGRVDERWMNGQRYEDRSYDQDRIGSLDRIEDQHVRVYSYDAFSRLKKEVFARDGVFSNDHTTTFRYGYDAHGRADETRYPVIYDGSNVNVLALVTKHDYDAYGHLLRVRNAATGHVYWEGVEANARKQLTQERTEADTTVTNTLYDAQGRLKSVSSHVNGSVAYAASYEYYPDGNLWSRSDGLSSQQEQFEYTPQGWLERSTVVNAAGQLVEEALAYDALGNIRARTGRDYVYDNSARIDTFDGINFEYDDAGRLTTRGDVTIEYHPILSNRVKRIQSPTDGGVDYEYTMDGERIGRTTADSDRFNYRLFERLVRDGGKRRSHILSITGPGGRVVAQLEHKEDEVGAGTRETRYLPAIDNVGSTPLVVKATGEVERITYGLDGRPRQSNNWLQPAPTEEESSMDLGFATHNRSMDLDTFIDMNQRTYDSATMQFIQADPVVRVPDRLGNLYNYADNNPTTLNDPTGLDPDVRVIVVVSSRSLDDRLHRAGQMGGIGYRTFGFNTALSRAVRPGSGSMLNRPKQKIILGNRGEVGAVGPSKHMQDVPVIDTTGTLTERQIKQVKAHAAITANIMEQLGIPYAVPNEIRIEESTAEMNGELGSAEGNVNKYVLNVKLDAIKYVSGDESFRLDAILAHEMNHGYSHLMGRVPEMSEVASETEAFMAGNLVAYEAAKFWNGNSFRFDNAHRMDAHKWSVALSGGSNNLSVLNHARAALNAYRDARPQDPYPYYPY